MKSILITGSTGFVGSNILENLFPKNKIFVILRNNPINKNKLNNYKKIKIISYNKFDQLNKKLQKIKVDVVVNCATHYTKYHTYNDISKLAKFVILIK